MISSCTRQSLARTATVRGEGLFTGRPAAATVHPSPPGSGIVFVRTDLPGRPCIAADARSLSPTPVHPAFSRMPARSTSLGLPGVPPLVSTCEHLLSALAGLGVTDATVELDGPELPIGDGSAAEFVRAIDTAGLASLNASLDPIRLREPIRVSDESGGFIEATPAQSPEFRYELDYGPTAPIPPQAASWNGDASTYRGDIARARTFCLEDEARAMLAMGLFAGLSPRDLLVFGPAGPIDNSLWSENEPARHKLLDLIGDLALAGRPLCARVVASRSGHALNHTLALRLMTMP